MAVDSFARTLAAGMTQIAKDIQSDMTDMEEEFTIAKAQVGTPLTAANAAAMTDHSKIYVYVKDPAETGYTTGNWYFWNGTAWESGGVYNSTALQTDTTLSIAGMAADAKVTGDDITDLKNALDLNKIGMPLLPYLTDFPKTNHGVVFTKTGDFTFHADVTNGDGSTASCNLIALEPIPDGFEVGKPLFIYFNSTNSEIFSAEYFTKTADTSYVWKGSITPPSNRQRAFTLESNVTGLLVRVNCRTSTSYTGDFTCYVSNHEIGNDVFTVTPANWYSDANKNTITDALQKYNHIEIESGTYTTEKKIVLPAGASIKGRGLDTILKYNGAAGDFITCGSGDNIISDITLDGGLSSRPTTYGTTVAVTGIHITGENYKPTRLSNITVIGFSKNGILVDDGGYSALSSIIGNNIYARYCGAGICFTLHGEYGVVTNSVFMGNYYGAINSAGNNKFANCGFEANVFGLYMAHTANDAHSSIVGCSFNHNVTRGLTIETITGPYNVVGCQFYSSHDDTASGWEVLVINGNGLLLTSCLFGINSKIRNNDNNGKKIFMCNCLFENAPTFSETTAGNIIKNNCYQPDGTPVT